MIKTIVLSCLAISALSFNALAQDVNAGAKDERQYNDGPVTLVQEIAVEYGHFEEYIDWLNSKWKPTMEATKKAGIIIDYKVFSSTPPSPDHPDIILWITYKNMAALDRGVEEEEVAKKADLQACRWSWLRREFNWPAAFQPGGQPRWIP